MSLYDTYGGVQLKVGPCQMDEYAIGDEVPIGDGVYIGADGVVVVLDGKLAAVFDALRDKWGGLIFVSTTAPGDS